MSTIFTQKTPNDANYALLKNISLAREYFWTNIFKKKEFADFPIKIYNVICEKCNKILYDGNECICVAEPITLQAGRGRKKCKNCPTYLGPRTIICTTCGYNFKTNIIEKTFKKKDVVKPKIKKKKKAITVNFGSIESIKVLIDNDMIEENILLFRNNSSLNEDLRASVEAYVTWRNDLIERNMRLGIGMAQKIFQSLTNKKSIGHLKIEDLSQVTFFGLRKAVTHFDINRMHEGKHIAFSTYANDWIRKEIYDEIYKNDKDITVPHHIINKFKSFKTFYNNFIELTGREPFVKELADGLKLKESDINGLLLLKGLRESKMISVEETFDKYKNDYGEDVKINKGDLALMQTLSFEPEYEFDYTKYIDDLEFSKPFYKDAFLDFFGFNEERKALSLDDLENKYGVTKQTLNNQINKQLEILRQVLQEENEISTN